MVIDDRALDNRFATHLRKGKWDPRKHEGGVADWRANKCTVRVLWGFENLIRDSRTRGKERDDVVTHGHEDKDIRKGIERRDRSWDGGVTHRAQSSCDDGELLVRVGGGIVRQPRKVHGYQFPVGHEEDCFDFGGSEKLELTRVYVAKDDFVNGVVLGGGELRRVRPGHKGTGDVVT